MQLDQLTSAGTFSAQLLLQQYENWKFCQSAGKARAKAPLDLKVCRATLRASRGHLYLSCIDQELCAGIGREAPALHFQNVGSAADIGHIEGMHTPTRGCCPASLEVPA